jgi:uncharacterized iron-regulated membrane protein
MSFKWMVWHRRLGLVTCFGILLWGLSGMSHPIMSRLQPKPAAFTAPTAALDLARTMSPQAVLACHRLTEVQRISTATLDDKTYFRVAVSADTPARYFSANDCQEHTAGDEAYARQLASHYTGRSASEITDVRFITRFDEEYLYVNRLLPVWRVEFSGPGQLRAFIDTDQARLSTLIDDTRHGLGTVFRLGHNWAFADKFPRVQLTIMAAILGTALFSAISGITLYIRRRRHSHERLVNQPARRWHRRMGLLVALTTLTFAASGMFHLIMSYRQQAMALPQQTATVEAATLTEENWQRAASQPAHRIDLVHAQDGVHWLLRNDLPPSRVAILSHGNHHAAAHKSAAPLLLQADARSADDSPADLFAVAKNQAAVYAGLPVHSATQTELVTRFGGEYGFIFKRLPVVKVQFAGPGNPRYYIEPATGALAAQISDVDATEGKTFAYLHKWTWLDANKELRDILMMLFALGNVIVALLGLWLFSRRSS